jgi:hypothetical protein
MDKNENRTPKGKKDRGQKEREKNKEKCRVTGKRENSNK